MVAAFARTVVGWTLFALLSVSTIEFLLFGRLEPTNYLPGAVGAGIGLAVADRVVEIRPSRI